MLIRVVFFEMKGEYAVKAFFVTAILLFPHTVIVLAMAGYAFAYLGNEQYVEKGTKWYVALIPFHFARANGKWGTYDRVALFFFALAILFFMLRFVLF